MVVGSLEVWWYIFAGYPAPVHVAHSQGQGLFPDVSFMVRGKNVARQFQESGNIRTEQNMYNANKTCIISMRKNQTKA